MSMTNIADEQLLGSPHFSGDDRIAELPSSPLHLWRTALAKGVHAAVETTAAARGDFAIAVQDDVHGCSFGAVDRFGLQSICYRVSNGRLRFAERADQLAETNPVLDPQAIFDYLYFHCIPSPRTVYQGVYRLPPGHYVSYQAGTLTVAPYAAHAFTEPRGFVSFDALRDEFRALLKAAVTQQLDGGIPACFLSGGTDSSTVAGMIREATGQAAQAYSIGFEADGYDEMAFARIAAKHFGSELHEYYVTPEDLVRSIGDVARAYDQPFGNSSALPAYYCALQARKDGVTRLLAGDGGDELFGGNARYAKQRVFGWYQHIPAPVRRAVLEPLFGTAVISGAPLLKKGSSYVEQARVPMPDRLQMYNLLLRLGIQDILTPDFLAQINADGPAQHQREVWNQTQTASELNRTLAFDWRYTLAESDLPKVRVTTQLAGVDVGFPMLDNRLLDFSLRLPERYKLKGLKLRWFFKEALRGFLPDEILTKKKQGFGLPFGVWMTRHDGLHKLARDSLRSLATRGIVRPPFITQLMENRLPEHPGYYGEMVWILMMLEQWMQGHAPDFRVR